VAEPPRGDLWARGRGEIHYLRVSILNTVWDYLEEVVEVGKNRDTKNALTPFAESKLNLDFKYNSIPKPKSYGTYS